MELWRSNTLALIAAWYGANIAIIMTNKALFSIYSLQCPVFLTLCHMVACTAISHIAAWAGLFRPARALLHSKAQLHRVIALASLFCLGVVLSNVSMHFIPISFNQAIASTTPAATAAAGFLLAQKNENLGVYLSLIPIVFGLIVASRAEPSFHLLGFVAELAATLSRGMKTVVQGILLTDASSKLDSLSLLHYMAPVSVVLLIPSTAIFEGNSWHSAFKNGNGDPGFYFLLSCNCLLAYCVNLTNFLVTKRTSTLTLQVLGNAKGAIAFGLSLLVFRNPTSTCCLVGYGITLVGLLLYAQAKNTRSKSYHNDNEKITGLHLA